MSRIVGMCTLDVPDDHSRLISIGNVPKPTSVLLMILIRRVNIRAEGDARRLLAAVLCATRPLRQLLLLAIDETHCLRL